MKISAIGRQKDTKGVGAPEMPAKEVNPDVGFREASPSVAAAALAAARSDGDDSGRGRGSSRGVSRRSERPIRSGRGTRSRTAVAAEDTPASDVAPSEAAAAGRPDSPDDTASDAAHRRRRRGGRGRGRRGRRGTELELGAEPTNGEPAEISWQEVDSLDELDGLQAGGASTGGELAFEEADATTLAELGLTDQPAAASAAWPRKPRHPSRRLDGHPRSHRQPPVRLRRDVQRPLRPRLRPRRPGAVPPRRRRPRPRMRVPLRPPRPRRPRNRCGTRAPRRPVPPLSLRPTQARTKGSGSDARPAGPPRPGPPNPLRRPRPRFRARTPRRRPSCRRFRLTR